MDLIEKTAKAATGRSGKSLVEKAAERLGAAPWEEPAAPAHPAPITPPSTAQATAAAVAPAAPPVREPAVAPGPAPAAPAADTTVRRQTRQQITIDYERLRAMGFVVPGDQSMIAEEIRLIKRPLLRNAFASDGRSRGHSHVIMVTSARPAEGKTFTAINLALSMASERDITVLLIDSDLAQPQVPAVLGFEADKGLADVLTDPSTDMADVLIRTNIDNLSILPAGRDIPHANELFASARMAEFIDEVAKRYHDRMIIFDSPPLLARSEPSVLATHMGQVVFVIEAESTSESAVREALGLLGGHKNVGLVLNKVQSLYGGERFGQYYSKYYGYR